MIWILSIKKELRKKYLSISLRSTKQCHGCFTCSASFNLKKENLPGRYYQHSHFTNEETEKQALLKLQVGERCFTK